MAADFHQSLVAAVADNRQHLDRQAHVGETGYRGASGVAPIPANSGQVTTRYRLNRYEGYSQ